MARNLRSRFQGATALEKAVYTVLLLVLAVDVALIVFARADDDADPAPTATQAQQAPAETAPSAPAGEQPSCADVDDPGPAGDPVTCRTRTATLTIAGEKRPVILAGTQVRLLSSALEGPTLTVRLRVRNETAIEQSVAAGGQELYVNLNGVRVDPDPLGEVLVPPAKGVTTELRFVLTPRRVQLLRRQGGRAELGIKPWDDGNTPGTRVGVIRFAVPPRPSS